MINGTVKECTMGGLRIRTQNAGDTQFVTDHVKPTPIVSGSGELTFSGEVQAGSITIPAIIYPDEVRPLMQKIAEAPAGGWPCTFTLFNGQVWGFTGNITGDVKVSVKEAKVDLEFTGTNFRRL